MIMPESRMMLADVHDYLGLNFYENMQQEVDRRWKNLPCNDAQRTFLHSTKKYGLFSGAVRSGKTLLGCNKGFLLNMMYPGNRGLICRKEASSLPGSTIQTLLEQVIPSEWIVKYNKQSGVLIHKTPMKGVHSTIIFSGLDKKADQTYPTKIGSTEYGWVFPDEGTELIEGDWNMLMTRLSYMIPRLSKEENDAMPRLMFTATNPDSPLHFLYKFFFECNEEEKKHREVVLTTPYENPYLAKDYIQSLEESLHGLMRERLLLGKWSSAEGLIYKGFNPMKHVVDENVFLEPTQYKRLIVGADANFPLPRAALIYGLRGDGSKDILDEFYMEGAHIEDLADWIIEWFKKRLSPIEVFHDPSSQDDINKLNSYHGIVCENAKNAVSAGISEVSRHFENNIIRINSKCVNLIKYLQTYRWKPGSDDVPLKKDDHICDALRYGFNSINTVQPRKHYGSPIYCN